MMISRRQKGRFAALSATALCLSMLPAAPAFAQDSKPAAAEADDGTIIVTALRRNTALVEAPASITAIDADSLRDQQITDLSSLGQKVPGLTFSEQIGVSQASIRGIALTSTSGGLETPVAMFYDGVYLPAAAPLKVLFMDVGSVEVLRGPQGTLYGRNATGGALNFRSAKVEDELTGTVDASYANYDTYQLRGSVSGPLLDSVVGFRISGLAGGRGKGWAKDLGTGERLGEYREKGVRGALAINPTAGVELDLSGVYYKRNQNVTEISAPRLPVGQRAIDENQAVFGPDDIYSTTVLSLDPRRVRYNSAGRSIQESRGVVLGAKVDVAEGHALSSKTSYFRVENDLRGTDCDATQIETCTGDSIDDSKVFQQEFNLTGDVGKLGYVLGAYYGRERQYWQRDYVFSNSQQGAVVVSGSPFPNGTTTINHRDQLTKSYAVYGDLTYNATEALQLFGGARWAKDKRDADFEFAFVLPGNPPAVIGVCEGFSSPTGSGSDKWSKTTFKAGAKYELGRGNVYGQFQQGFKAGGFNPASCGQSFEQETVNAYEIGYKVNSLIDGVDLRLSAFHYDYSQMQVYVILPSVFPLPVITNADSAVVDGLEAEVNWRVSPRFKLDLNMGWIPRAKYNAEFLNTDPFTDAVVDLNGNRLPMSAKLTLGAGAEINFPVGNADELTVRGEIYYNSGVHFTAFNTADTAENGYMLGNLFATYKPNHGNWSVRAFVRNITDEKYFVGSTDSNILFNTLGSSSEPRSYGVGVNMTF
ncbi:TonB-dependent receptor [Sphingopyxis kveilinensis]|uniref:TonB-dependent receptor n=1 Tax=Sphingopyxis kveilinensis TaxID=3114367 RepID=UPI0030D3B2CE